MGPQRGGPVPDGIFCPEGASWDWSVWGCVYGPYELPTVDVRGEGKSSINEKLSYYSEGHCYQEDGKRMPEAHCYEMMMKEIDKMPKGSKPMPFDPNDDRSKMKVTTPRRDGYSNVKKDRKLDFGVHTHYPKEKVPSYPMLENKNKGCVSCNKKR